MKADSKNTKVSIISSFRKSPNELQELFEFVQTNYTLLSPESIDWENPKGEFVRVHTDGNATITEVEERHLEAMRDSDFIILHAPEGYVGVSAAYELGFAKALGIPIVSTHSLKDKMLAPMVHGDDFLPRDNAENSTPTFKSGVGLKAIQKYYARTAKRRGWDEETAKDTLLLLTEELGELARAVRKHLGMNRDHTYDVEMSDELADVQLYLVHLANQTGIDLGDAVTKKEAKNELRFKAKKF